MLGMNKIKETCFNCRYQNSIKNKTPVCMSCREGKKLKNWQPATDYQL